MEEDSKNFKVKDRRRFDEEGKEREQDAIEASRNGADFTMKENSEQQGATPELSFSSFVMSLATQALLQLGHMSPPAGVEITVDKNAAKQTIEILSLLREKTKGNLDKDEDKLFEEMLHSLRMAFVSSEEK